MRLFREWMRLGAPALFFVILGLLWALAAGKDLSSDFRNYHLYAGALLLQGRLTKDYFPAAVSGYLNPFAELPVYGMVMAGWNDQVMACALALLHLPNLYIVWKLAEKITMRRDSASRFPCWAATLLAFASPIQLTTLSNTFADPVAGFFTLLGIYLLLRQPIEHAGTRALAMAGLMLGVGAGLKLTNLLFIPAAVVVLGWMLYRSKCGWWRGMVAFTASCGAGFLVVDGWWAWQLYQQFGNPIFPLYNSIFHSPDFISADFSDRRMQHYGAWTWVWLPFSMLQSGGMVYSENSAPDIRLLCLVAIIVLVFAAWLASRMLSVTNAWTTKNRISDESRDTLRLLLAYFIISYVIWGMVSGIGRYGYVLWLMLGPLLVGLLAAYVPPSCLRVSLAVMLIVQVTIQFLNGNPSWSAYKWSGKWVDLDVPQELREQPATYLLYGVQSNSFIIPYFHPGSRFSNFIGQYVQPIDGEMSPKMHRFLDHPVGPRRVVFETNGATGTNNLTHDIEHDMNAVLSGYGYKIKNLSCPVIKLKGSVLPKTLDGGSWVPWTKRYASDSEVSAIFWVCDLEEMRATERKAAFEAYHRVDAIFDSIEDACGSALSPHRIQTVRTSSGWLRNYFNTITVLGINGDDIFIHPNATLVTIPMGNVSSWPPSDGKVMCPDIAALIKSTTVHFEFSAAKPENTVSALQSQGN